ncbi:hypothetical protein RRG08_064712 [Elysia crispata]|uniref:Uncharacterized protein n=1 Tax=Elysia crispata TaxID=231223 RepID=A0AAE0Z0J4_9GAST|nr:hypothetical protein RRG08_064712 [Elysia crispata]
MTPGENTRQVSNLNSQQDTIDDPDSTGMRPSIRFGRDRPSGQKYWSLQHDLGLTHARAANSHPGLHPWRRWHIIAPCLPLPSPLAEMAHHSTMSSAPFTLGGDGTS